MPAYFSKLAYFGLQQGKALFGLTHKQASSQVRNVVGPKLQDPPSPLSAQDLELLSRLRDELIEEDWRDAEMGLYPTDLLFDAPWLEWAMLYPRLWMDLPSVWDRRSQRIFRDLPSGVEAGVYPNYYLQNFHDQTDGYLSDHSAELYDLQVEILFNGAADAMRRRILKPIKEGLRAFSDRPAPSLRVLDVATGTGRTLIQLRGALPRMQLVGLDLSSAYLRQANRWLAPRPGELPQLVQGNAEQLPFADGSYQALSCVFLLHELPAKARQNVIDEAFRVLEPGGILVLADSIQRSDSPDLEVLLDQLPPPFPRALLSQLQRRRR